MLLIQINKSYSKVDYMEMWKRVVVFLIVIFIYCGAARAGYIESTVWNSSSVTLKQNQLELNINIDIGPGYYNYNIFKSSCAAGEKITNRVSYVIVPKKINISGVMVDISWQGPNLGETGSDWIIMGAPSAFSTPCITKDSGQGQTDSSVKVRGVGYLDKLPPGNYSYTLPYYVGNAFGISASDAVLWVQLYGLDGKSTQADPTSFTGAIACGQDDHTSVATIDFGTITSNGSTQPGPLTTLELICNYDVALKSVEYSLTSNNPVTGEPSSGKKVSVALTNGATVTLNAGNITQPDSKKVSLDITSSIDTRKAIAGEGNGSATLIFNYE